MHNGFVKYFFLFLTFSCLISSCYQKKSTKKHHKITSYINNANDTIIEGINMDSIDFIDSFKLLPTKDILTAIQKNSKTKATYRIPVLKHQDSIKHHEFV